MNSLYAIKQPHTTIDRVLNFAAVGLFALLSACGGKKLLSHHRSRQRQVILYEGHRA
jgi:hypothetical protein